MARTPRIRVGRTEDKIGVIVAQEYYAKKAKAVVISATVIVLVLSVVLFGVSFYLMKEYSECKKLEEEYFLLSSMNVVLDAYSKRISMLVEVNMSANEKKMKAEKTLTDLLITIDTLKSTMEKINTGSLRDYVIPPLLTLRDSVEESRNAIKNMTTVGSIDEELMRVNDKIVYLMTIVKNMKEEKAIAVEEIRSHWIYSVFRPLLP